MHGEKGAHYILKTSNPHLENYLSVKILRLKYLQIQHLVSSRHTLLIINFDCQSSSTLDQYYK
jgi:hypothetical protein